MRFLYCTLSWLLYSQVILFAQGPPAPPGTPMLVRATGYFIQARDTDGKVVGSSLYTTVLEWLCNQPRLLPDTVTITNPSVIAIADDDHPGMDCRLNIVSWRTTLPAGTRYSAWVGAVAPAANEVAVAPDEAQYVVAIPNFNVVPFSSSLAAPTGGRLF